MLELNKIYCMDCLEGLNQIEENIVDLIIIDPPYSSGTVSKTEKGRYKRDKFLIKFDEMSSRASLIFLKERLIEMWRVTKIGGHLYCFCDSKSLRDVLDIIELSSWKFNKILVWDKLIFGTGRPYRSQVEFILFASKSTPRVTNVLNHPDIFKHKRIKNEVAYAKPEDLISEILSIASRKDDLILDCFMGSGTTALACKRLNLKFIGFEINQNYVKIANKRLQQEVLKL